MISFPHDVAGWLTEEEGFALSDAAAGRRVLEIGSYCGRSTICLAQAAESVVSVDPHDGRGTPEPRDTYGEMCGNLQRYGVSAKVDVVIGTLQSVPAAGPFGLVFIDGAHDYPAVAADIAAALCRLSPGGQLALHDYRSRPLEYDGGWDAGVKVAVDELLRGGAKLVSRVGTVVIIDPADYRPSRSIPVVAVGMPCRDFLAHAAAVDAMHECAMRSAKLLHLKLGPCATLEHNFNRYWAEALNARDEHGATHFAMLHADVCPEPGWLTLLLDALLDTGGDVVSANIPLRDWRGLTSTAVYDDDPWVRRRLTLRELEHAPPTFGAADVGRRLLLNSGLWVCDLRREWCDDFVFQSEHRISRNGRRRAEVLSEDWYFSHWLNERGAPIFATSTIRLRHDQFPNYPAWGAWETDEEFSDLREVVVA